MLLTASWAIAVCGRPDLQPKHNFWQQDCAAAAENILLAAADIGLGTCWCGCYPAEPRTSEVQKVLGVTSVPVALIAVGVPDEAPAQKGFYDPSRVHFYKTDKKGRARKHSGAPLFCLAGSKGAQMSTRMRLPRKGTVIQEKPTSLSICTTIALRSATRSAKCASDAKETSLPPSS